MKVSRRSWHYRLLKTEGFFDVGDDIRGVEYVVAVVLALSIGLLFTGLDRTMTRLEKAWGSAKKVEFVD